MRPAPESTLPHGLPYRPATAPGAPCNTLTTKEGPCQAPRLSSLCEGEGMAKRRFLTTSGTGPGVAAIGGAPDTEPEELRRHVARNRANRAHHHAKQGDLAPFLALLRDPEAAKTQADCELAAELLEGRHKRTVGGQADRDLAKARRQCASLFVVLTEHLGVKEYEAVPRLAECFASVLGRKVGDGTIREWIKLEKARQGKKRWAELIGHAGEAYEWLLADFLDDNLRRLFNLTDG